MDYSSTPPRQESRFSRVVFTLDGIGDEGGNDNNNADNNDNGESSLPLISERIDRLINESNVIVFGRTYCPFLKDAMDLLTKNLCVHTHLVEIDVVVEGDFIVKYLQQQTQQQQSNNSSMSTSTSTPFIFVRGKYIGGCEELYYLYNTGELERTILVGGLIHRQRTVNTDHLETAKLAPIYRGKAVLPFFMYPVAINNHVTRVTALLLFALSIVCAAFFDRESWVPYLSAFITADCLGRFLGGPSLSSISMLSRLLTIHEPPYYMPGPAKQIDSFITLLISVFSTGFFFAKFDDHYAWACAGMVILAMISAVEGLGNFSLGPILIELGIYTAIFDDAIYRIYNATLLETVETYNYIVDRSHKPPRPKRITTDRNNPIALRYKRKSEEWTKYDFDPIRHMKIQYFYCPLSIAGLAWAFRRSSYNDLDINSGRPDPRTHTVDHTWFEVLAPIAAFVFIFMMFMYITKAMLFFRKVRKEWNDVLDSTGFATVAILFMLFGLFCWDTSFFSDNTVEVDKASQVLGRVFWWIGSVCHAILTVKSVGDWICQQLDLEHIYPHWLVFPVGFGIAACCAPVVGPFGSSEENRIANAAIANFYYSFGLLTWLVLFTITFLKYLAGYNSDPALNHGIWLWVSAPATFGFASMSICAGDGGTVFSCADENEFFFFIALLIFFLLFWLSMPFIGFLRRDEAFTMVYWIDCFALSMLAAGSALFYISNGWLFAAVLEFIFLAVASLANLIALLHTIENLILKSNVATPRKKRNPLQFIGLTHDAILANLPTLLYYLNAIDLDSSSREARDNLGLFAAHFNRYRILMELHFEEGLIYKACTDYFPDHGKKFILDHRDDRAVLIVWCELANIIINRREPIRERQGSLERLRSELPPFFSHLIRHFRGEEENLGPIWRNYFPIELKKQLARDLWRVTPAERWEVIIPFVLVNLSRHEQRICFLRSLLWSIPERSQQVGAIVYRNVDAVMWERLRVEIREMVPRGAPHWVRQY